MLKALICCVSASLFFASPVLLLGCQKQEQQEQKEQNSPHIIRVGVISGPEFELMKQAAATAKSRYHLNIEPVAFARIEDLNPALANKQIDANVFQYQAYLDQDIKHHGYHLAAIGQTYVFPMGLYSKRLETLSQIPYGGVVAIPSEPTNEARALLLIQKTNLISLKSKNSSLSTVSDIINNPRELQFKTMPSNQLPKALADVDLAAINANFALRVGLLPFRDALVIETSANTYADLVVVRSGEEGNPDLNMLVQVLHAPEVEQEAQRLFEGQLIPTWK